ncbi:MAG: DUF5615 family PIN-like protein [Bacteroidetes bacterium]|nr:DUF5615 family PIN-like protein [Bacteroidota bacterium]MBU2585611.1 DUF5615 family PIN-like protein [Bacteroidota bacterium]
MKFKLDENFGKRAQTVFKEFGYDVETVLDEKLQGCSDKKYFQICSQENRCLVTLDKDFSYVIKFNPSKVGGIVVIRPPKNPSLSIIEKLIKQFLGELKNNPLDHRLWIVELGRIRIHQTDYEE